MNTQNQSEISIGVDVGKANLDIAIYPLDRYFRIPNTREAIQKFLPLLKELYVERIVVEATGRYEHPFVFACDQAKLPICVVNPIKVRRFAQALGIHAKTDKIDAHLLAKFAATMKPEPGVAHENRDPDERTGSREDLGVYIVMRVTGTG